MRYLSIERALLHIDKENRELEPGCIVHRLEIGHKEADGKIFRVIGDVRLDAEYTDDDNDDIEYGLWFTVYYQDKGNHNKAFQYVRDWLDTLGIENVSLTVKDVEDAEEHVWEQVIVAGDGLDYQNIAQVLGIYVDAICNHPDDENIYATVRTFDREYLDFEDCRNIFTGELYQDEMAREHEVNYVEFKGEKFTVEPLTHGDTAFAVLSDDIQPSEALLTALTTAVRLARENDLRDAVCIPIQANLRGCNGTGTMLIVDDKSITMDFMLSEEQLEILKHWPNYDDLSISRSGDDYGLCTYFLLNEMELNFIARFITSYMLHFDVEKKHTAAEIVATLAFDFNSEKGFEHEIEFAVGETEPSEDAIKAGLDFYIDTSH